MVTCVTAAGGYNLVRPVHSAYAFSIGPSWIPRGFDDHAARDRDSVAAVRAGGRIRRGGRDAVGTNVLSDVASFLSGTWSCPA